MSIWRYVFPGTLLAGLFVVAPPPAWSQVSSTAPAVTPATTPAFPESEVRRWQTGLARADRLQHTMFSLSAGLMIGMTSEQPYAAAGGALGLGIVKEVWDLRRATHDPRARRFDVVDVLADALGAAGAYAITNSLTR